jgi:tRNA pseudouridine32 synthase / 23S rRNA pseudouridine746 synthase
MQPEFRYDPPDAPLQILYRDDHLLLVNKPAGLLSVPGKAPKHGDCLETRVRLQFAGALLVHRLDMDTSGVMLFALNKPAQRHLGLQFERRQVEKIYVARVWGQVTDDVGIVDLPLIADWPNRPLQMVDPKHGKPALTHWRVLEREAAATRVELRPKTGRSHQLRVHLLALGHVILGDRFYAHGAALAAADRLQLHASRLQLDHPDSGVQLIVTAPVPF